MKLAFIKKKFSVHGGAERYLQTLMGHLKMEGHEIHIFANEWAEERDVIFHKVNVVPFSSFLSVVTFNRNARRAIERARGFDHVISFERTTCQDIYRAGEGCHAEWLRIRSRFEPFYKRLSFRLNPLHVSLLSIEKRLLSGTKLIIANSRMVKAQVMEHYGVSQRRITVVYNGVDLVRFSPENRRRWRREVRTSLGISEEEKLLLFVGSGFERKGLGTLIRALSFLKKEKIRLAVVGRGETERYRNLAGQHGVAGTIVFHGPREDIEKCYSAADLFVLPTLYDPFSNAALEAMASGLPVVTTKNNGVAELIENNRDGYVVEDPGNARELSDKIYLFLGNLETMGKKAREKAEEFPIERAVQEFTEAIEKMDK